MKKIIAVILAVLCIGFVFTGCNLNDVVGMFTSGGADIEYETGESSAKVTKVANKSTVTEIVIPDEYEGLPVTEIADFAISNLRFAEKIIIGKNVEKIGAWSLRNNENVTEITVSEENEHFADLDGVLYTKDMKSLVAYPTAKEGAFGIPDTVETIGTKAFYKCAKLTAITLPESLKTIEEKAFFRCNLEEIAFPEKTEFIGKDAFAYCGKLTTVTIPSDVKEIGDYAFYSCTALLDIKVQAKEADLTLGEKWYPTNNGIEIGELKITWAE